MTNTLASILEEIKKGANPPAKPSTYSNVSPRLRQTTSQADQGVPPKSAPSSVSSLGKKRPGLSLNNDEDEPLSKKTKSSPAVKAPQVIKSSCVQQRSRRPGQLPSRSDDKDKDKPPFKKTKSSPAVKGLPRGQASKTRKRVKKAEEDDDDDDEDVPPSKKAKSSPAVKALPRGQASKIRKRAKKTEEDDEDNDWLEEDDGYRPRRKSKLGQMVASGLVAGMK